jgi:WD40 repeat protein
MIDLFHTVYSPAIVWSRDGSLLALNDPPSSALAYERSPVQTHVWDADSGREIAAVEGILVGWAADSPHLVTVAEDKRVLVWDALSGLVVQAFEGRTKSAALSPDGHHIAIVTEMGRDDPDVVNVWNLANGRHAATMPSTDSTRSFRPPVWAAAGRLLAVINPTDLRSGGAHVIAQVWDAQTGSWLPPVATSASRKRTGLSIHSIAGAPVGPKIASLEVEWFTTRNEITLESRRVVAHVLASGHWSVTCTIDLEQGGRRHPAGTHSSSWMGVSWSPDGSRLATWERLSQRDIGIEPIVQIWSADTGRSLAQFQGKIGSWSPDGHLFTIITRDATGSEPVLSVWDTTSWKQIATFRGSYAAWSPDTRRQVLAVGQEQTYTFEGLVDVRDIGSGGTRLFTHPGGEVAWAPDGQRLIIGNKPSSHDTWTIWRA